MFGGGSDAGRCRHRRCLRQRRRAVGRHVRQRLVALQGRRARPLHAEGRPVERCRARARLRRRRRAVDWDGRWRTQLAAGRPLRPSHRPRRPRQQQRRADHHRRQGLPLAGHVAGAGPHSARGARSAARSADPTTRCTPSAAGCGRRSARRASRRRAAARLDSKGRAWIVTSNGLAMIEPGDIRRLDPPPAPQIRAVIVDGKPAVERDGAGAGLRRAARRVPVLDRVAQHSRAAAVRVPPRRPRRRLDPGRHQACHRLQQPAARPVPLRRASDTGRRRQRAR